MQVSTSVFEFVSSEHALAYGGAITWARIPGEGHQLLEGIDPVERVASANVRPQVSAKVSTNGPFE